MLWPAFLLGLFGSFHCAAMCSPIMLSVPWRGITSLNVLSKKIFYQIGRISSYVLIGTSLFIGGKRFILGSIQQGTGILIGLILILYALISLNKRISSNSFLMNLYMKLTRPFGTLLRSSSLLSRFGLGALNGFLPCGLVYIAGFTALTQDTIANAALYMVFFGLGTLPMILGVFASTHLLKHLRTGQVFNRLKPMVLVVLGALFIVRSLELGIPLLSPVMEVTGNGAAVCAP